MAPLMLLISKVAAPAIWLLNASTRVIFQLFGAEFAKSDNRSRKKRSRCWSARPRAPA